MAAMDTFDRAMANFGPGQEIGESVRFEDQAIGAETTQQVTPALDLSNLSFSVKSTDMGENMILFIVEKTILAFESSKSTIFKSQNEGFQQDYDTLICTQLKFHLDTFYKPHWHVICGENYGSFFTHLKGCFIVFTFQGKWLTVFKSA